MTIDAAREWSMVAFPGGPGGGNPAGVVFDPPPMDDAEMTRVAVRLNPVSETAFVGQPREGVFPLRYFAPGGEVPLCGHATAAAFGALALAGRLGQLPATARSAAPGGSVEGRVEREGEGVVVWMDMPIASRVDIALDVEAVAAALGLPHAVLASRPAAAVEDVGIRVALLPLADLAALDAMRPAFHRLRDLGRPDRITVFYAFVFNPESGRVRARSFAPAVDIDEDPATGTATAALGAYLAREGLVDEEVELRLRQGEAMGRPSELRLRIEHREREPRRIRVGGAVTGAPA
ncbi:MAG TPA: PhzF family phenazine biosynthesis isomerase [Longimicrobiales bacterium]|nr:PhzF family phenazine biosynthesis isomerase [Longimicrobiales bacterium]